MFVDELKVKLNMEDLCQFTLSVFDNKFALIEGVKNLVFIYIIRHHTEASGYPC